MGDAQTQLKKYGEAINTYQTALNMTEATTNPINKSEIYKAIAVCYENSQQPQKALAFWKLFQAEKERSIERINKQKIDELGVKYETIQKDKQLAQQQVKILQKQHQITQIALLISFLSLSLGGIFAVYRTRQRRKIKKMEINFEQTAQQLQSFNYSVSLDLRHPLINAQHALNKLQQLAPNTAQAEQIKKATNANKQMKDIIEGLLTLTNIDRNSLRYAFVDTNELVADVLESFDSTVPIQVQNLPQVRGDVRLLREVFNNLISNALKYSSAQSGPQIVITAQQAEKSVAFEITDNGTGFDEELGYKLFQLFGRLHPDIEGIGVGLVIVKRIVEKHGGRVWARGKPNEGATFGFELPR